MTEKKQSERQKLKRRKTLLAITVVFLLALAGYGAYAFLVLANYESTENAYVGGNMVVLASQVSGTVDSINADDTRRVPGGSTVVQLDPTDARVELTKARAHLASVVRTLRERYARVAQYQAVVAQRQVALDAAKDDLARRVPLAKDRTVSGEAVAHARQAVSDAKAALDVALRELDAAQAGIKGVALVDHPDVREARQAYVQAWLQMQRTAVVAPVTGYVAKRSAQVGTRVTPGTPLLSIVPLNQVWVDANFKESDLKNLRIGQPVTLEADMYGSDAEFHGKVLGLSAGTGSAFSLLPAQNATGNWIKVVQRVPVRIALNPDELEKHPLRVGLSMHVTVDTHDRSGPVLDTAPVEKPVYVTQAPDLPVEQALEQADEVIAQNS
jgi:membrane fusion protein (multidrug efflux system)